jgi:GNAT superfamily N-acetyltransferase
MEIYRYESTDIQQHHQDQLSKFGLWWADLEEAGIETVYLAWDGDTITGFQTVSLDGLCVAIEVDPEFQGQGIARALINESGCTKPERNENPEFWEAINY